VDGSARATDHTDRRPWRRRLAVAGIALGAIVAGGVFALVVSGRDDAQPLAIEASPTPSAAVETPSPAAPPSPMPTPSPVPTAAATPTPESPAMAVPEPFVALEPVGFALNTVDRLSLRAEPGLDAERLGSLSADSVSVVLDGPVSADGYTWYQLSGLENPLSGLRNPLAADCAVPYQADPWTQAPLNAPTAGCPYWLGWVAAASLEGESWLRPVSREDVSCPETPLGTETYRSLTAMRRLGCFGGATWTLRAFIAPHSGDRGWMSPYEVSVPPWLHDFAIVFPQPEESEYDGSSELVMHVHPDLGRCDFGTSPECPFVAFRGQWVEIHGHLDDPASRSCVATYRDAWTHGDGDRPPPPDPQRVILECRTRFVATDLRVVSVP
jgi:hypothetical protein